MKPRHENLIASLHNALRESYRTNKSIEYRDGLAEFCRITLMSDKANQYEVADKINWQIV